MLKRSSKAKSSEPPEDHKEKSLFALPTVLRFETLSVIWLDKNHLDHTHLDELFSKALLLCECSFRSNRVVKVPRSIAKLKKLKNLNLEDNPVGWPRPPRNNSNDWRKAVKQEPIGRKVFRIYDELVDGAVQRYTDVEVVCMADPMFRDKDEDRSDVRFGGCRWAQAALDADDPEGLFSVPTHDRGKKNRFGDPDTAMLPWYKMETPTEEKIFPAEWLSVSVMDGHGGPWVAEALKQNLLRKLISVGVVEKELPENYQEVVTDLYRTIDETLLSRLKQSRKSDGSTCVNAIFRNSHTLVSHVGDSRCVLGYRENCVIEQVTNDHEPDVPAERESVEKKGGKVEFHKSPAGGGVWRVNGDLAMSRSFGDPNVKKVISADPDVVVKSGMAEIDAVVIASDGLWHHVSSENAIKAVRDSEHAEQAAVKLYEMVENAIRKGKNTTFGIDNTMIVVAKMTRGSQSVNVPKLVSPA